MATITVFSAILLIVGGVYLTFESGFFQLRAPLTVVKATFGAIVRKRDLSGFKAMAVALGGTIGVGNIIGVAAAVTVGGAGAVFWMLVSGILGMIIKYAEINICVSEAKKSKRNCGGPMYVMRTQNKGCFKYIGVVFAVACIVASLTAGNFIQSRAIYGFLNFGFGLEPTLISFVLIPVILLIISGHDRAFQNFSAVLVPLMSVFYIGAILFILFRNREYLYETVLSVLSEGLGIKQFAGGAVGSAVSYSLRTGLMKGLFTNEAGMGSSPIAHSGAENADPFVQGCWGIVEVFFDTVVVCMLTAVAVLSSAPYRAKDFGDPFSLTVKVFESAFGSVGIKLLTVSIFCFALAAMVGWTYYGLKCLEFLNASATAKAVYRVLFVVLVPLSTLLDEDLVWSITDALNSAMLIPNLCMLLLLGGKAVRPLRRMNLSSCNQSRKAL